MVKELPNPPQWSDQATVEPFRIQTLLQVQVLQKRLYIFQQTTSCWRQASHGLVTVSLK
jgi:hypothetical protein